jgi:hypothetical protein
VKSKRIVQIGNMERACRGVILDRDDEKWVTPEKSVFRTRIPRPTNAGAHLAMALVMFLLALGVAIYFAER